jgi:AcrR family transcriptional regulator
MIEQCSCKVSERILHRREEILEAATDMFAEFGYRATDVQQIADNLKIGKGTIYRYFPTKEELFFATADRAMRAMEAFILQRLEGVTGDVARVKKVIRSYIEFYEANPKFIELFVQERAEFRRRQVSTYLTHRAGRDDKWRAMFERLFKQGYLRVSNINLIIEYLTNGLYGIVFTNALSNWVSEEPIIDQAIDMLLYGFIREEKK